MIVNKKTGKIAYHAYRMRADGGLDFVQYGFDGKVLYIKEVRPAMIIKNPTSA